MTALNKKETKRRPGRPRTDSLFTAFRCTPELLDAIDAAALEMQTTRSDAIRALVLAGLEMHARPMAGPRDLAVDILAVVDRVDPRGMGDTSLADIRAALPQVPRAELDAAVLDLERRWLIDCNVAQQPTAAQRRDGIVREGRGVIFYVCRRSDAATKTSR